MLHTAAIITEMMVPLGIRPIIVGGLSVEYATHDIDFVMEGHEQTNDILQQLGFTRLGKNWIHDKLGVTVEVPSSELAGDYSKVTELPVMDRSVYIIGIEDIILDRLRAAVHWKSGESREWGYRMLLMYYEDLDLSYIQERFEHPAERSEFELWIHEAAIEKPKIPDDPAE